MMAGSAETWSSHLVRLHRAAGEKIATDEAGGMLVAALAVLRVIHGPRHVADLCDALAHDYTDQTLKERT
jgi:hypothetical protein